MPDIHIDPDAYNYSLPDEKIARFPLAERSDSRLLFYDHGLVSHHTFKHIPELLPANSYLFFNETKVIPARLTFQKSTGANIEIFLLNPVLPSPVMAIAMEARHETVWKCMVKNMRKWKDNQVLKKTIELNGGKIQITANILDRRQNHIRFTWEPDIIFGEIIEKSGMVPLPPYLKREPVPDDKSRYQTVYSREKGAVAAPTAGLHFTKQILDKINSLGHATDYLTLHVSAGTFQPIREKNITRHAMHREQISFHRRNVMNILNGLGKIIAVGTTSLRALESIYWYGFKLLNGDKSPMFIEKLFPYRFQPEELASVEESLRAILDHMKENKLDEIQGETEIFIFPGYPFRVCNGLITNYHMPRSTLILLVAAFVGDNWQKIYREALSENYRFLSYGDSSLLLP